MLGPAVHASFEAAAVEAGQGACDFGGNERVVARGDEEVGDAPDVFFGGHPVLAVQAGEIDRDGVGTQSAFAAQVVVVLEVAEGEFAQGAVDGRTEAQASEVRLGNAAPEAAFAVEGDDVVVVVNGFEVHEQGWVAVDAQGDGGKQRSLQAVALALAQGTGGRPCRVGILIGQRVQEALDFYGRVEGAQGAEVLW